MYKLFTNAVINTMLNPADKAIAMLVEDGVIREMYYDSIPHLPEAELINLGGADVYPGFIDTHTHSFEGGLYSQAIDLINATSLAEVLEKIDFFYRQSLAEDVNIIFAYRFDENQVTEKRFPTSQELSQVCPDKPLLLRRIDGHSCAINLLARELFLSQHPNVFSIELEHDDILRGDVNDMVVHWLHGKCSDELILKAYHNASRIAAKNGHTSIHTMIGDARQSITHYKLVAANLQHFPVEYMIYPQSLNLEAALEAGATRIGGCILADGAFGSHTAAVRRPYHDEPSEFGMLYQTDEYWYRFISEATKNGLQVAIHCIGDRAIKQINDIYLRIHREYQHDLRHEIIHAELTPDDLVGEIALSHAVCVMQPAFDLYWGGEDGFYFKALGTPRFNQMNRFKTMENNGILVTGGSDWYITELDALQGIRAAVHHNNVQERISPFEAVKLYTANAARLSRDEHRLGILTVGMECDFVCLTDDLMNPDGLVAARVNSTYKQGVRIYQA